MRVPAVKKRIPEPRMNSKIIQSIFKYLVVCLFHDRRVSFTWIQISELMTKKLLFILTILSFFSCGLNSSNDSKVWVYLEMKGTNASEAEEDYFFGQMRSYMVEEMRSNKKSTGIFFVDNIRFINSDDLLEVFEDASNSGTSAYRLENIKELDILKDDPALTFKEDLLHESCKKVRAKKQSKVNSED